MYSSVEELFEAQCPRLVGQLGNLSSFWQRVKNNTITNKELASIARVCANSDISASLNMLTASVTLLDARLHDQITTP